LPEQIDEQLVKGGLRWSWWALIRRSLSFKFSTLQVDHFIQAWMTSYTGCCMCVCVCMCVCSPTLFTRVRWSWSTRRTAKRSSHSWTGVRSWPLITPTCLLIIFCSQACTHLDALLCTLHNLHFMFLYRASACNACRAQYCFTNSVCLSVCLSGAGTVLERMDITSHFLTLW